MVARRRAGEDAPPATQDDRTTTVRPGELFACDNTRPYRLIGVDHTHMTVLCVPRASLGRRINSVSRRTAIPLSARIGIGRLVGHALSSATEELADHSPAQSGTDARGRRAHRTPARRFRRHHPRAGPRRQ
ncbi:MULTISPECIES: hypothetical protein [unclassified Streptomyces]|uniref:AraC-like ligand-binding domain-containing protein n=1 Tax=unclassified Streptomyces TaxID=2593676 RepID=UPI002E1CC028